MIILKKGYTLHAIAGTGGIVNCTVSTDTTILFRNKLDESEIQICKADINDVIITEIQLINTSESTAEGIYFYIKKLSSNVLIASTSILPQGTTYYSNNEWKVLNKEGITIIQPSETVLYITKIDTTTSNLTYIGKSLPNSLDSDPMWQIKLIDESSGVITILFADGNETFDKIWDDRLTYTYS